MQVDIIIKSQLTSDCWIDIRNPGHFFHSHLHFCNHVSSTYVHQQMKSLTNIRPQFSFSSGASPAHNAARYYHYLAIASRHFSPKNPTNMMPGESALAIHHCGRVLLDAVQ